MSAFHVLFPSKERLEAIAYVSSTVKREIDRGICSATLSNLIRVEKQNARVGISSIGFSTYSTQGNKRDGNTQYQVLTNTFVIRYELAYKANIEWVVFTCGKQNHSPNHPIPTHHLPHSPMPLLIHHRFLTRPRPPLRLLVPRARARSRRRQRHASPCAGRWSQRLGERWGEVYGVDGRVQKGVLGGVVQAGSGGGKEEGGGGEMNCK